MMYMVNLNIIIYKYYYYYYYHVPDRYKLPTCRCRARSQQTLKCKVSGTRLQRAEYGPWSLVSRVDILTVSISHPHFQWYTFLLVVQGAILSIPEKFVILFCS